LHQLVPSNVALLLQRRLNVVMVSGRELVMRKCYCGAGVLEVLINTGRNADTVWMLVHTCQCFQEEFDSVFSSGIACAVEEVMLIFVGLFAAGTEYDSSVLDCCYLMLVDPQG
jgi:hypothetical protein